ncbi:thermonuclease family protein, partial [Patescibacteria group bacterium]|nr:thermonuclease family protein [Patescibacteria group bacterium]
MKTITYLTCLMLSLFIYPFSSLAADVEQEVKALFVPTFEKVEVEEVVSSENLIVKDENGELSSVKLIGLSSPIFGSGSLTNRCEIFEAERKVKQLTINKTITLRNDETTSLKDYKDDKYRYAILSDGRNLNELLLREGIVAFNATIPFSEEDKYEKIEEAAQKEGLGIWGNTPACNFKSFYEAAFSAPLSIESTFLGIAIFQFLQFVLLVTLAVALLLIEKIRQWQSEKQDRN